MLFLASGGVALLDEGWRGWSELSQRHEQRS